MLASIERLKFDIGEFNNMIVEKFMKLNKGKVFTKKLKKDIMETDYIPLKVNYENLFEKDGLLMEKRKEILLDEEENVLIKKFSKSKKFIELLRKICDDFNIDNYKVEIKEFLENS